MTRMTGMAGIMGIMGVMMAGAFGQEVSGPKPAAKSELQVLAEQYQLGADRARDRASERDRLAIQAQSAIIGLKDAELQMERAVSGAREFCGRTGKILVVDAPAWACAFPAPSKPAGKDVDKK